MDTLKGIDRTRYDDLTIKEIKSCPSFAHFTDEQANEVIETLKTFTKIVYDCYKKSGKNDGI